VEDRGREKTEIRDGSREVAGARERHRLAVVDAFDARQLVDLALDAVGDRQEHAGALGGRRLRPGGIRRLGRGDRAVDVHGIAVGDLRVRRADGRIDVVEVRARGRLDEVSVDEVQDLDHRSHAPPLTTPRSGRRRPAG
jgi:hypothetical protein